MYNMLYYIRYGTIMYYIELVILAFAFFAMIVAAYFYLQKHPHLGIISEFSSETAKLRSYISKLESQIMANTAEGTTIKSTLESAGKYIVEAKAAIDSRDATIANLNALLTTGNQSLTNEVNSLKASLQAKDAQIAGLQENLSTATTQIKALTSELAEAATSAAALQIPESPAAAQAATVAVAVAASQPVTS